MQRTISPIFLVIVLLTGKMLMAQPINDDCANAILLTDVSDWCSNKDAYTTVNATPSGFGKASCFGSAGKDVWFRFTAIGSDATLIVRGNDNSAPGGTLTNPEVAIYSGDCSGPINEQQCASATGQNVISLHKSGLGLGVEYLIRVQGKGNTGTFELCITNYNPPSMPGQDCMTSSDLCDKTSFTVQQSNGVGSLPDEAKGTCLGTFGPSESSSTWFTWTAGTSGSLTFTLTPTNEPDDLDFVVYELPNGNCGSKVPLLCNAAGDSYPSPCMGPTGLRAASTDSQESPGCLNGNDGWLKPLDMIAGKTYALLVNNYSNSGSGFTIDFGGSGTFQGPNVDFTTNQTDDKACYGDDFVFSDQSTFPGGSIALWEWSFGVGSTPSTAIGQGPHTVSYNSIGTKLVSLKITSAEGCILTLVKQIEVLPCCETVNTMLIDTSITHLKCYNVNDGAINLLVTTNASPVIYSWDNGLITPNIAGLSTGSYEVTITNAATCDTTLTFEITSQPEMQFDTTILKPTCNGGQDGQLEITTTGGVSPYEYNFENMGFSPSNSLSNIPIGVYSVIVRDANGCVNTLSNIDVKELVLLLNPNVVQVDTPSCAGFSDGRIQLGVQNGLAPFQYDFGSGFTANSVLANIPAGTYDVTVQDANLCHGDYQFVLPAHPPMTLTMAGNDASCFGLSDGAAFANAGGGVGNYSYLWDNQVTINEITNIPAGIHSVTVTDGNDCKISDQITINEPPEISILLTDLEGVVCFGDQTGVIELAAQNGISPYLFAIDTSLFQQDSVFQNLQSGWHLVASQDANGCIGKDSVFVPQPEKLIVQALGDTSIQLGYKIKLGAIVLPQGRPVDYQWYPNDAQFNFDTIPSPILRPKHTGYYYVQITDSSGCVATDSVLVQINSERPIYTPNTFSPNGDGINDFFTLFGGPATQSIKLFRVFDRMGNLVFSTKNIALSQESVGWDGMFRGKQAPSGTYVWEAMVLFWDDQPLHFWGDITLIR